MPVLFGYGGQVDIDTARVYLSYYASDLRNLMAFTGNGTPDAMMTKQMGIFTMVVKVETIGVGQKLPESMVIIVALLVVTRAIIVRGDIIMVHFLLLEAGIVQLE